MPAQPIREKGGQPLKMRGVLGILARRMKTSGGVEMLEKLSGAAYRTLHQWAGNMRPIASTGHGYHLEVLCRLWDVPPIAYDRHRPGGPPIPENHLVVSASDGWWLLAPGGTWEKARTPFRGVVGHLTPASFPMPSSYDVPKLPWTLPGALREICAKDCAQEQLLSELCGIASGLDAVIEWAPPALVHGLQMALRSASHGEKDPSRIREALLGEIDGFYQG